MRVSLTGGAYQARSLIASAQRQINLYSEDNPQESQAPAPVTLYPTPGLRLLAQAPNVAPVRAAYRATNGDLYVCVGTQIYFVNSSFQFQLLGTIPDNSTPVSFSDNGLVVIIVDGTETGYCIDITPTSISGLPVPRTFGTITDPSFLGANFVDYIDTFFVLNQPGTANLYLSLSNINFVLLTQTSAQSGNITAAGSAYTPGTYIGVPLTGGSGLDATVDIEIQSGVILTGSISAAGTGYVNGTYQSVSLTGGTGTLALANIVVSGGKITSVTIVAGNAGSGYAASDVLSAPASSFGGTGSGFTWTVATIGNGLVTIAIINAGGSGYILGDVLSIAPASVGGTGSGFQFTITAMAPAFDPLDIAAKTGSADPIQRVVVVYRTVWPLGTLTSEAWIDSGAADFALQPLPGVFIEHGCIAPFSVACQDNSAFWLSQDRQGKAIVVKTRGYVVQDITPKAIAAEFQSYGNISDAIGFTFQIVGHVFYVLCFPSANKTWAVDIQSLQWFEWAWTDNNGNLNRHRANCCCFAYGLNIVGDWQNGNIYALDINEYTDSGQPISRIRSFPHLIQDAKRLTYSSFIADIQVGTQPGLLSSDPPMVSLRWSDDRGATYGNRVEQSMGSGGQYLASVIWNRCGMARDRVFELSWSAPMQTSLQGAFIDVIAHRT